MYYLNRIEKMTNIKRSVALRWNRTTPSAYETDMQPLQLARNIVGVARLELTASTSQM